jgi:hypothetical protein
MGKTVPNPRLEDGQFDPASRTIRRWGLLAQLFVQVGSQALLAEGVHAFVDGVRAAQATFAQGTRLQRARYELHSESMSMGRLGDGRGEDQQVDCAPSFKAHHPDE